MIAASHDPRPFGHLHQMARSPYWWLRWRADGVEHDVSTKTRSLRQAERFRARTAEEVGRGAFLTPRAQRTTFEDLQALVVSDYTASGRRSLDRIEDAFQRLAITFRGSRARSITRARLDAYVRSRQVAGAATSTIRIELNALARGFALAQEADLVIRTPTFPTLTLHNARQGFFSADDLAAVLGKLPAPVRPVVQFLSLTGWRRGEALGLRWSAVDFANGVVRIETSKTDQPREFPFGVLPALTTLLEQQRTATRRVERRLGQVIPWVFHRDGKRIEEFHKSWDSAVDRAAHAGKGPLRRVVRPNLVGRLVHDLRRTAARNFIRAGVPQHVVMQLCGWKTDAMFRRYAIVDLRDREAGVALLAAAAGGDSGGDQGGTANAASR